MTKPQPSTHDRLRREAAALFARRGYGGTSMSVIANRVGIRKASLYNYYDSKADLMVELLEQSLLDWERACRLEEIPGGSSVEQRLAAYLAAAVRFSRQHPQSVGIIRLAAGQMPSEVRDRVQEILDRHDAAWRKTLTALFTEAIERGEVEPADPYELGLFWSVFVHGLLINQIFATNKADAMVARLESLWQMFWRGLSGRLPTTELQP